MGKLLLGRPPLRANPVYGALQGLETFSQLCTFDYETKSMQVHKSPWNIRDKPRFAYRGLLLGAIIVHGVQNLWVSQPPPNIQYAAIVIGGSFIIEGASLLVAIQAVRQERCCC
ncbi:hypothetical protein ABKV19_026191 [Rosa sericea]